MENLMTIFSSFVAFVTGVIFLTETVNKLFKVSGKTAKLLISWLISLALAALGFWQQLGFLADCGSVDTWQGWTKAALVGIGCGLCANKMYDRDEIWRLLEQIFSIFKKKNK